MKKIFSKSTPLLSVCVCYFLSHQEHTLLFFTDLVAGCPIKVPFVDDPLHSQPDSLVPNSLFSYCLLNFFDFSYRSISVVKKDSFSADPLSSWVTFSAKNTAEQWENRSSILVDPSLWYILLWYSLPWQSSVNRTHCQDITLYLDPHHFKAVVLIFSAFF